jgi:hypothetical protein
MKYIEVDIYMNQLVSFFEKNPNDLISLIGELQKDDFYKKVKETCIKNFKENGEVIPTQKQLIDIVVELKQGPVSTYEIKSINQAFQKTKFGILCLN